MRLFQDLVNILLRSLVRYKIVWENTVITNAGIELLKNALSGGTITVTAIKSGAGKVDVSALKSQTAVSSIKQSGTVQGVTKTNETIKIGVLFSNAGLSAGYSMTQLGIYAKGSTGSEVLFAISQSTTGKEVPAESAMPSWSLVHNFYIKLNNDVTMTATVDPEGYVTFETMQTALNTHTGNKSNPHSVTKSQVGLGNVPNVATNDQTPTYSDATTLVTLSSGEKISIAFAKIKLAITTLINHLANKSNPHGVTKSQVGLGNVENKSSATIRGELTKGNVTTALGFTPANQTDMTNAQDAITQLNSDIRKTEFALSNIDSKYKFVGNCYKQNKRVYINGYFHCTSPNVGTTTCFFVPEGFRPKIKCGSACYTDDDVNFNNIGAVKVDTNGDITIYFPTVYSNCVYVSMVYDIN